MRKTTPALLFPILFLAACGGGGGSGSAIAVVWAQRAGGTGDDFASAVAALPDGSSVVTGFFEDEATFGPGHPNETTLFSAGGDDTFVARYDADGSILVGGGFHEVATFGAGEAAETVAVAAGRTDAFLARFRPDGSFAAVESAGGANHDELAAVTGLADGSAAAAGYFTGEATFDPGGTHETTLVSAGFNDAFIARFEVGR